MLTKAGIPIVGNDAMPPMLGYTEWQAHSMELGAQSRQGLTGAELDAAFPLPTGLPPISYFIGAWVSRKGSDTARLADELLGTHDWSHSPDVVFPNAVLALFVADAFVHHATKAASVAGRGAHATLLRASDVVGAACGLIQDQFQRALDQVFQMITIKTGGDASDVTKFFAGVFNIAVGFARTVIGGLVKTITAPITSALGFVVSGLAIITQIGSAVTGWNSTVDFDDEHNSHYKTGTEPGVGDAGHVKMTSTGLANEWPAAVRSCAAQFGVDPPTGMAPGSPVDWNVPLELPLGYIEFDRPFRTNVDSDHSAHYGFHAIGQPADIAASNRKSVAIFAIAGSTESDLLPKLRALLTAQINILKSNVLGPLKEVPAIRDAVDKAVREIFTKAEKLLTDNAQAVFGLRATSLPADVEFHAPDDPADVTTTTTPKHRGGCGVTVADLNRAAPIAFHQT
jgi:hypothetical protein